MKFCYCPECNVLRPRNWYLRTKCEICGGQCKILHVKVSIFGWMMYLFSSVAVFFLFIFLVRGQSLFGSPAIFESLPSELLIAVVFASIFVAFILQYLELSRATKTANGMLKKKT